ncbi:MAG: AbrB/MazE/SpoVT family DNA-binding domain-containing protein [Spirochaetota bacterium]
MLVTIDKRGSVGIPQSVRKALELEAGSTLNLEVEAGGTIILSPTVVYGTVRLSETGLGKLAEARGSGTAPLPGWLREAMNNAAADPVE